MRTMQVITATAALVLLTFGAHAELIDVVNDIRSSGCKRRAPAATRVATDAALDAAAGHIARGSELEAALTKSGYRATSATAINIGGVAGDAAIRDVLADGFCDKVNNAAYTAIGTYVRGKEFWMVLAQRFEAVAASDANAVAARVLELVNEARAQQRRCGRQRMSATHALTLSAPLTRAAAAHAADMAANGFMGHRGSDGSEVGERVRRAGYVWRSVGENVAAGQPDPESVVRAWLDSPGHCTNLMGPQFVAMGVAFVAAPQSELRILWAQVFAAPQ
ncbi:MAG TPA: CAP domain-containing protein [Gammaproteobacteria bacterium]|nr:CAP domain-containing protein [Gammaproteobacteria bacterium]